MNNAEIRNGAKSEGILHWQIAERYGIQDSAFSRKLRHELPEDEKKKILKIIKELAAEKKAVV